MPRKKVAKKEQPGAFIYKGVKQIGDARLWSDKNVAAFHKLVHVPVNMVGPGDIVDDLDPKQRYTFYLYVASQNDDSARERDRLRRAGYVKCDTARFCSPTEKFEARDGALVLGQGIWYALPEAKMPRNQDAKKRQEAMQLIASAHADLADEAKALGYEAVESGVQTYLRGQRTK